jgi:hypothetical protein
VVNSIKNERAAVGMAALLASMHDSSANGSAAIKVDATATSQASSCTLSPLVLLASIPVLRYYLVQVRNATVQQQEVLLCTAAAVVRLL